MPISTHFCHFICLIGLLVAIPTSWSCREGSKLQFEGCYIKIGYKLTSWSEIRNMWGNPRFWYDHDKYHNFTKSLKITHFGSRYYFSTKFYYFLKKSKSNWLILDSVTTFGQKYVKEIHSKHSLGKYFPTFTCLVDTLNKSTKYINYQVKGISHLSCVKKSDSLTMEEVQTKKLDPMRFTHNKINHDVTYDSH